MATSTSSQHGNALDTQPQYLSLTARALLSLGLLVGFYALAIGVSAALLYIPYAEWYYANRIHGNIVVFCVVGAIAILSSIVPRPDRFVAPGPRLDAHTQPQLFQAIDQIATLTGQKMPAEVYLVPDVNVWVADRGGVMGFGSRRVMALGLPLLQLLSVAQLRAVLAHEFGHFHAGDTRLGPWVYRTRVAIARTLQSLHGSVLQRLFILYGKLFLRVSHAVSRKQEFAADRLAARTVGASALIEGLKKIHGAAAMFDSYWRSEVAPVLHNGYRPPITEGFGRFFRAERVVKAIDEHLAHELVEGKAEIYDTHPSLRERIAAAQGYAHDEPPGESDSALSLICNLEALELELLQSISTEASGLKMLEWEDTGTTVYMPLWKKAAAWHAHALTGWTVGRLPELLKAAGHVTTDAPPAEEEPSGTDEDKAKALFATAAAIAVALLHHGWQLPIRLGEAVRLECDGIELQPFDAVHALADGTMSSEMWRDLCETAGIADLELVIAEDPASA